MHDRKLHINDLAAECRRTGANEAYSALYDAMLPGWKRRWPKDVQSTSTRECGRVTSGDYAEIESLYNMTLFTTVQAWDPAKGNFEHMFNQRIKQRKIDLFRVTSRRTNRVRIRIDECYTTNDDEVEAPTFNLVDSSEPADTPYKRKRDQLELISSLAASADDTTLMIVKLFPQYDSITALAKALGMHHEVVKRKLRALSKHFRQETFGDYREYLAV